MRISTFIDYPFVYLDTSRHKWFYILFSIIFSLLFLVLFRPFGLDYEFSNPENSLLTIIGFLLQIAFATGTGLTISQFICRPFFRFQKVTIGRYIIWYFVEAGLLTLMNLGFAFLFPDLGNDPIEEELTITFQFGVYFQAFVILLFPFLGTIIYVLIKNLNSEIQDLEIKIHGFQNLYYDSNSNKETFLEIFDENENLELRIQLKDFLFAESSNQYVLIHYKMNEQIKKHIVRTRLKTIIDGYKTLPIEQCHRSFVVNLINVKSLFKIEGKTFLAMDDLKEIKLPVSKSHIEIIKNRVSATDIL
ncbi:hypothetical protein A9Q86_07565 [Flavobacteriales bacterium 33_180_T64]|nr:hypothetical protein A9Q86_07565 [Flavobacteriales bacterium 33_180_T64]